jgi:periplasmic nitrate reductase NapD
VEMNSNLATPTEMQTRAAVPPETEGTEGNICGVLVHVRPERLDDIKNTLCDLPGTEIHQFAADGRIVVTVEDVPGQWAGNTLTDISNIKGVLSAALVFHHRDGDDAGGVDEEETQ